MFNFFKSKKDLDADSIGEALIKQIVLNQDLNSVFKDHVIKGERKEQFEYKASFYRLAIVLLALTIHEKKNPKFEAVRKKIEKDFFNETGEGIFKAAIVNEAMESIGQIINTKSASLNMRWAMSWLDEIGIKETNPERLTLVALGWRDMLVMVSKALQDFDPLIK